MHEIDMSNDRANVAYVGKVPWHGLGTELEPGTSIEEWKIAAGLDWTAERRDVLFRPYDFPENTDMDPQQKRVLQQFPDRSVIIRSDTLVPLSIMSKSKFNIVQPGTVLEFYRDLVEDSKYDIEVAGCLKDGRIVWALGRSKDTLRIKGQDKIKPFLLFSTALDGTMSTIADLSFIRVVCNNTLMAAVGLNGQNAAIRIPHMTKITPARLQQIKGELGLLDDWIGNWETDANKLADLESNDDKNYAITSVNLESICTKPLPFSFSCNQSISRPVHSVLFVMSLKMHCTPPFLLLI